ncbi:hypothetical protein MKY96_33000 [Paenibacillus sp. FSL R7-0302]|uniref:hypothetical protein n=1 Tax=Paenibacillus sp. FSL R7-0302 TaxID=2921681 RepID=UPI0030FAD7E2
MEVLPLRFTFTIPNDDDLEIYTADWTSFDVLSERKYIVMWIDDDGYPSGTVYSFEQVAKYVTNGEWVVVQNLDN